MVQPVYPPDHRPVRPLAEQYEYLLDSKAYREAHPDPVKEKITNNFMAELEAKEDEWAFLYDDDDEVEQPDEIYPSATSRALLPQQPVISQPKPNRNDRVAVRYTDGTILRDVKYKKVEADVQAGTCVLL